jgi:predicted phosphohydrolase
MHLAFTADLHWGTHRDGDAATRVLAAFLRDAPPDVLVLAGDMGTDEYFGDCLALFADLPCRKALVPGNHDLWVRDSDERGDSLRLYREHLPQVATAHGFHYLDHGPLFLPETNLALAGSVNWYDYSWSLDALRQQFPGEEHRLGSKRFTRGRHNDANFIRWPLDDVGFTREVVAALKQHLTEAGARARHVIVVTHHPPFQWLSFARPAAVGQVANPTPSLDGLLWQAFAGNRALEELLERHADIVPFAFCGHTHQARQNEHNGIRGYNVGGNYHHKRLLLLDWPAGTVTAHGFAEGAW